MMIECPQTFIFIGRSGSGKGTQAELLQEYLGSTDPGCEVHRVQLGARVRDFIAGKGYTNRLSRETIDGGELQPGFLMIGLWASDLIENLGPNTHLIFDGTPRKKDEAVIVDGALIDFYNRKKIWVLLLNISEEVARKRLKDRGREDDRKPGDIEKRMTWYKTDVEPTIDFFQKNSNYRVVEINGEQPVEAIHKEIVGKIDLG